LLTLSFFTVFAYFSLFLECLYPQNIPKALGKVKNRLLYGNDRRWNALITDAAKKGRFTMSLTKKLSMIDKKKFATIPAFLSSLIVSW